MNCDGKYMNDSHNKASGILRRLKNTTIKTTCVVYIKRIYIFIYIEKNICLYIFNARYLHNVLRVMTIQGMFVKLFELSHLFAFS